MADRERRVQELIDDGHRLHSAEMIADLEIKVEAGVAWCRDLLDASDRWIQEDREAGLPTEDMMSGNQQLREHLQMRCIKNRTPPDSFFP
jgi:hypothetical protein